MFNKQLKKIALLLIIGSFAVTSFAQEVPVTLLKIGKNPYTINDKAALEVDSTTKGFLLPRMTKQQRDSIATTPPAGLQVWCTDCDTSTVPVTGQLCVYTGTNWIPLPLVTTPSLSTGKKTDANKPVYNSTSSVTVKGVLIDTGGAVPVETGIIYKQIISGDLTLPVMDLTGTVTGTTYKTLTSGGPVTAAGATITVTLTGLNTSNPYYFRTYARTALGVGYGNPVSYNIATAPANP